MPGNRIARRLTLFAAALAGCSLVLPEPEPVARRTDTPVQPVRAVVTSDAVPPQLPIIFFSADGADLDIGAREKIEVIASIAKDPRWDEHPLLVRGHSDGQGGAEHNRRLSRRRAELVAAELVFTDVPRDRIVIEAAGAEEPIAPNRLADGSDNPDGRALNRRVEVRLLVLPGGSD
ncbi:hypothetical protein BH24PSE2_BH24PSE2_01060 [soil metagenome]